MQSYTSVPQAITKLFDGFCSQAHSGKELYLSYSDQIDKAKPAHVIAAVDFIVAKDYAMPKMKTAISKALNLLHNRLSSLPTKSPVEDGFLAYLIKNNAHLDVLLKSARPHIKAINKSAGPEFDGAVQGLKEVFQKAAKYPALYTLKENILFPVLEKHWDDYRCVQVMWSIHDDIRRNSNTLLADLLKLEKGYQEEVVDEVNECLGELFFDMYAIKFREEKILLPVLLETIGEEELNQLWKSNSDLAFPFINPEVAESADQKTIAATAGLIGLSNNPESWSLLSTVFKHLPIDITFVNAQDEVVFYSDPPHRVFPRTEAVIGRKVQNCHPKESLDTVNKIIAAFRKGEKEEASFWINMGDKKIQISYYAVRNNSEYLGVLEVSQEISKIQARQGEKRLLDW